MDYDVIYADDGRNAVSDRFGRPMSPWRPLPPRTSGTRTVVVPNSTRPTVITGSATGYSTPMQYPQSYSQYPQSFAPPFFPPQTPPWASRFGMTTGELIDTGVQLIAAILPLPGAPVAQGEVGTDVENLMTYQGALAVYAKRDEQLRTLGTLLTRILR